MEDNLHRPRRRASRDRPARDDGSRRGQHEEYRRPKLIQHHEDGPIAAERLRVWASMGRRRVDSVPDYRVCRRHVRKRRIG